MTQTRKNINKAAEYIAKAIETAEDPAAITILKGIDKSISGLNDYADHVKNRDILKDKE